MGSTDLKKLIDDFTHLTIEDKESAVVVIKKQLIESRQDAIDKRAKQAQTNLKKESVKKGGLKELYKDLESD
jgi:hypothetical protein